MEQSSKVCEKNGTTSEHRWISSREMEINLSFRRMGQNKIVHIIIVMTFILA